MRPRLLVALAAFVLGCNEEEPAPEGSVTLPTDLELGATRVPTPDDMFMYSPDVVVLEAHAPTRFEAPLPSRAGAAWDLTPSPLIQMRLCRGDREAQERVLSALRDADASGRLDDDLANDYVSVLWGCTSAPHCAWLSEVAHSNRSLAVRWPAFVTVRQCHAELAISTLTLTHAPPGELALTYADYVVPAGPEIPPPLQTAVQSIIEGNGERYAATLALAGYPGSAAAKLIRALQATEDRLGVDGGVQLLDNICETFPGAPQCPAFDGEFWELLVHGSFRQYRAAIADSKRAAKAPAVFEDCIRNTDIDEELRVVCLNRLAGLDWARARAAASPASGDAVFDRAGDLVRRFESRSELRGHLRALGLATDDLRPAIEPQLSVADELRRAGRLRGLLADPIAVEVLLYQLAALAEREFVDAAFEELYSDDAPVVVRAFADGKRWSLSLSGDDDRLRHAMEFLNVVLAERESDFRYLAVQGSRGVGIVAGPRDGLRRAVDERLLEPRSFENLP